MCHVSLPMKLIFWLLSVHMALFILDSGRERTPFTGGLHSLAMLTTALMTVTQTTRLLWVRSEGLFMFSSEGSEQKNKKKEKGKKDASYC